MANLIDSVDPRDDAFSGLGDSMLALGRPQSPEEYRAQVDGINQLMSRAVQSGGLGLARGFDAVGSGIRQGADAVGEGLQAIMPSQDTLGRIFMALEAGGAHQQGRAPLFVQQQQAQQEYALKRQQLSDQLKQQKAQQEQKDEDQALGLWRDHQVPLATKKKMSQAMAQRGNVLAANLSRLADEQLVAELDTLTPFLPKGKVEELGQLLRQPNADLAPIEQWAGYARERKKATQDAQFKSERYADLLQRHQASPFPTDSPEFDELKTMVSERKKREEEAQKLSMDIAFLQQKNPLEIKKSQQELARGNAPIVSPAYITPGGESAHIITDPRDGLRQTVSGVPQSLTKTQDMNATAQEKVIEARAVLEQIASLDKDFQASYVGPLDNLAAWAKETVPGIVGPISGQEEKFRKTLNTVVTNARRIDAGTAQSVQELAQLAKTYPDLKQHESVFKPALEAMRERITAGLKARSRLAAEIAAGRQKPFTLSERAAQLAITVSAPGFAKDAEDAKAIARQILSEEMKLGIVKGD